MAASFDIRDLRYFKTMAELNHLGRAAEQLCLSQPALTRCVRRLEDVCGTELFQRAGRGIRLTAAGEALLQRARRLDVLADETLREMHAFAHGDSGHVRLGVVPQRRTFFSPPFAARCSSARLTSCSKRSSDKTTYLPPH